MLPTGRDYFFTFMGILFAGAIPVPIYPPVRPNQLQAHLLRHEHILNNAQVNVLVTVPEAMLLSHILQSHVPSLQQVATPEAIRSPTAALHHYHAKPEDIALLQYTSGSTGNPKGVMLSHANLMANIRAMGHAIDITPQDTFVSWLPLYHDMGLIGAWLGMLVHTVRLVSLSPLAFLRRPERWLQCISAESATLSAAPNFAYELCCHKIDAAELSSIDLSSWRWAFNGAEPVSVRVAQTFQKRFAEYGFRASALAPVYGLAECSLGLTFPPPARGLSTERVVQETFSRRGYAEPTSTAENTLEFVACGHPLPGYQVRIVDNEGFEVPQRQEGHIQFQGPSATAGYWKNAAATAELFDGPWLKTGDMGYLAETDLYITRRAKDMIIRAGRNLFPYELEEAVGDIDGIRKGCVAVFGSKNEQAGTERVVVLAERRPNTQRDNDAIRTDIQHAAQRLFGSPVEDIVLAPPFSVLKTSSGKIRRAACRENYERGEISERHRPVWWQFTALFLRSLPSQGKRFWRRTRELLYTAYIGLILSVMGIVFIPVFVLCSTLTQRWTLAHFTTRLFITLSGLKLTVKGKPYHEPCLFVANHASYMDWLVLLAALPRTFHFVAKSELKKVPVVHALLRRLGTEFVERSHTQESLSDAEQVADKARSGQRLLIFPEGTFQHASGILPFRMGAFLSAAKADLPIVPICISGTRHILRAESWQPRWGEIQVTIAPPLYREPRHSNDDNDWQAAIALRDKARAIIVKSSGETALRYRPSPPTPNAETH